jgi:hypothetical protein
VLLKLGRTPRAYGRQSSVTGAMATWTGASQSGKKPL